MTTSAAQAASDPTPAHAPAPAPAPTPTTDTAAPVNVRIGLAGRDPAGLAAFARAVSTPDSPQYGHYLTPAQARARFGPTSAQLASVLRWLDASGLHVTEANPHWIDVTGTATATRQAFGGGMRPLAVPTEIAGAVLNVARIGQSRTGMHEGASVAIRARRELTEGPAHSDGVSAPIPTGTSPSATDRATTPNSPTGADKPSPAQDPTTPPPKTQTTCSPTWAATPADPRLPPGYTTPQTLVVCGYTPAQLRTAYGVTASALTPSALTATGVTVAVLDAYGSPTMRADADRFAAAHGDHPFAAGQYLETITRDKWTHLTDQVCQPPADWAGEEALDVETVHGLAPNATIHYFGANSCTDEDINATMAQIIDTHAADMVSSSFGETMHRTSGDIDPALVSQGSQLFQYAAAEGIGLYDATGDCGDESSRTGPSCDPESSRAQTDWPASSPWVTAVGGTALALGPGAQPLWTATMGNRRSVLSENGSSWVPFPGDFYFGGGGGTSEDFAQPDYQHGVVPDALATTLGTGKRAARPMRTLPDVAMDGDLMTAVLVGVTDATTGRYDESPIGGTSASAPMFAAVQADAQQARVAAGGHALGFANPQLYRTASRNTFTDVLPHPPGAPADISAVLDLGPDAHGKARIRLFELGHDQGLPAATGYDLATGLGSPHAGYLRSFKR
ncbi:MAG: S8/S53 family peptidase [Catenulispora sp.]|nr:S8/S53 family peptidase [Catenulispora sp.]